MCKQCLIDAGPDLYWANPHGEPFIVAAYNIYGRPVATDAAS